MCNLCVVDFALHLLNIGIAIGLSELGDLYADMYTLSMLVYYSDHPFLSSLTYSKLSITEVLSMMFENSTEENMTDKLSDMVVPYISRINDGKRLLHRYIISQAVGNFELCILLFEQKAWNPSQFDLANLVLQCSYLSSPENCIQYGACLFRILNCIPLISIDEYSSEALPELSEQNGNTNIEYRISSGRDLKNRLDLLTRHIRAWEIFSEYSIKLPLAWFAEEHTQISQHQMLSELADFGRMSSGFMERVQEVLRLGVLPSLSEEDAFLEVISKSLNTSGS